MLCMFNKQFLINYYALVSRFDFILSYFNNCLWRKLQLDKSHLGCLTPRRPPRDICLACNSVFHCRPRLKSWLDPPIYVRPTQKYKCSGNPDSLAPGLSWLYGSQVYCWPLILLVYCYYCYCYYYCYDYCYYHCNYYCYYYCYYCYYYCYCYDYVWKLCLFTCIVIVIVITIIVYCLLFMIFTCIIMFECYVCFKNT